MVSSASNNKLDGADMGVRYFTKDELRALFTLEDPHQSVTQQQLHVQNASRRHTDAELDHHLKFLSSISNFHGVSDHDLLFDKDAEKLQNIPEQQESGVKIEDYSKGKQKEDESDDRIRIGDSDDAANQSFAVESVVNDISVVLEDDDLNNRSVLADDADHLGQRLQGMTLRTPSPSPKRKEHRQPEIHYRGASVKKQPNQSLQQADILKEAEDLEEQGSLIDALDKYMDLFESLGDEHTARDQLSQKIMFLRKSIDVFFEEETEHDEQQEEEDEEKEFVDDVDVELFDDETCSSPIASTTSKMVIDSPTDPLPAKSVDPESRLCVVCM